MGKIKLEGIRLYGFHGCLDEEGKIGTEYRANVTVWGNLKKAALTDDLKETLDYVTINKIVEAEVGLRAKLIETVAQRIVYRVLEEMPSAEKVKVKLTKCYPPINGDVEKVSVVLKEKR